MGLGVKNNRDVMQSDQQELIRRCCDLAERFKERAARYDQDASFPVENFEDLKDAGLLGIMIPRDAGGWGADFLTYTKALEQLSMGDASTGLTFNMHNIAVGSLAELNLEGIGGTRERSMKEFRDWIYGETI